MAAVLLPPAPVLLPPAPVSVLLPPAAILLPPAAILLPQDSSRWRHTWYFCQGVHADDEEEGGDPVHVDAYARTQCEQKVLGDYEGHAGTRYGPGGCL